MLLQNYSPLTNWKELYTAALVETDSKKIPSLIAQASTAIILRARELFESGDENFPEEQALDSALHTLKLLGDCVRKAPLRRVREFPKYDSALSA